mmetsp:Transcript_13911/g.29112  ORF Transcript_13911/g.29112 Transcript_13911/m.29112 type:complete len:171 (-) Transcript_13911:85-597(-)
MQGAPAQEDASRSSAQAPVTTELDGAAAKALKMYARKRRPPQDKTRFYTQQPGMCYEGGGIEPLKGPEVVVSDTEAELPKSEEKAKAAVSEATEAAAASRETPLPTILKKFDIFDNIDEERIKEYEQLFSEARAASNYDEYKKRSKKADPNKFATCNGVDVKDNGDRVIS